MNNEWVYIFVGAMLAIVVPDIAIGASIGSLFFMLASTSEKGWRKAALLLVGWFVGYYTATPFVESGWAGLIAIITSAFAVVIMLQTFESFENPEKGTPRIIEWMIDLFNKVRRG